MKSTNEQQELNNNELEKQHSELSQQLTSLKNDNERLVEQIQQDKLIIVEKETLFKTQQDLKQQIEQQYAELEQKHNEQHTLITKVK